MPALAVEDWWGQLWLQELHQEGVLVVVAWCQVVYSTQGVGLQVQACCQQEEWRV
jgi:hypothetical protein